MKDANPLTVFRLVAREFKDTTDDSVTAWLELTDPMVSKKMFKKLWVQALALRTAHRMKLAGYGSDPAGEDALAEINNLHVGGLMRVTNFSEGDTSVGFNTNIGQYADSDAELGMTVYGMQYLCLRRMCIVPITTW